MRNSSELSAGKVKSPVFVWHSMEQSLSAPLFPSNAFMASQVVQHIQLHVANWVN